MTLTTKKLKKKNLYFGNPMSVFYLPLIGKNFDKSTFGLGFLFCWRLEESVDVPASTLSTQNNKYSLSFILRG